MHKRTQDPDKISDFKTKLALHRVHVETAEQVILDAIVEARSGQRPLTWTTIGECLGITKQAAMAKWRDRVHESIASRQRLQRQVASTRPNRTKTGATP